MCYCNTGYQLNSGKTQCISTVSNGLNEIQIQAIVGLLKSFGAETDVINSVESALRKN